jgi:hypothetical protein
VHPAAVRGAAEAGVEFAERTIECGVKIFGTCLGPDDRPSGGDGDLDTLAAVRLARITLVEELHVDPDQFLVVPFDLAQLVGDMFPIVSGNLYVAALDDNVHS